MLRDICSDGSIAVHVSSGLFKFDVASVALLKLPLRCANVLVLYVVVVLILRM